MHIPVLAAGSVFDPIYNALGAVLAFFYSLIPNLGVAIILMTVAVMLVLYPLTAKQAKSMLAMQRVQPEIKKLQAKYKGDRQKLNEEVMKFYQENKINPLAGCLPLVVQLPIFFTLFRVLRDPFKHIPKTGSFAGLYNDLCGPNHLKSCTTANLHHLHFLSIDLQKTATDSHGSFLAAIPFFLLVGLVMITGYAQTKQAQSRTPQTNKQMGTIMKILPVFFGVISLSFPAGLVLYFVISNLWRVGQQEVIFRRIGAPGSPAGGKQLPAGGASAQAIDVVSADHEEDETSSEVSAEDKPVEAPRRPAPRRPAAPEPRPARASVPEGQRSGGLRGFFQLPPPPPEGNGGGRPPGPTRPSSPGSARGSGTKPTGGPPPQQRRSAKKKRKR
jgi:YidC/Oxa1 family membrane protein insertase